MTEYWAKISEEKIIFYSEDFLEKQGRLSKLKEMRKNHKIYQKQVSLSSEKIEKLEEKGIKVLRDQFLALNACWHWFTGYSRMDAFRLTQNAQQEVEEKGYLEVNFAEEEEVVGEKMIEDLSDLLKLNPSDTLFVVSCTPDKIWDHDPTAPDFIPARYVYRGKRFLKFLKWVEDNEIEKKNFFWVILSGKYGFIEPWHPISRYDVNLSDPTTYPISDETLKNQVKQKRWWRNNEGMIVGVRIIDFKNIVNINCSSTYKRKIRKSLPNAQHVYIDTR